MDATPILERQLQQELEKVAKQYGGGPDVDMTKFPVFKFEGMLCSVLGFFLASCINLQLVS